VYLVAVVDFVKSLGEIHDEHVRLKAFLEVLGEIVDKLEQLCLTQDMFLRKLCCSWYRMSLSSPCSIMFLANTCSIILQQTEVSETGR
jgi:hypothetical protein